MEKISGQSLYEEMDERHFVESAGATPAEPTTVEPPVPTDTVVEQIAEDNGPIFHTPENAEESQKTQLSNTAGKVATRSLECAEADVGRGVVRPAPHSAGNQTIERPEKYHDFICDGHKTHDIHDPKDNRSPEKRAEVEHEIWKMEEEAAANRKQSEITAQGYSASPADQAILEDDLDILRKKGLVTPKVDSVEKDEAFEFEPKL